MQLATWRVPTDLLHVDMTSRMAQAGALNTAMTLLLTMLLCWGCQPSPPPTTSPQPDSAVVASRDALPDTSALPALADSLLGLIAEQRWDALARSVHPERGLRVSPYGFVDSSDVILPPAIVSTLSTSTQPRLWGRHDGSGKPIRMTFEQYYERFLYDRPYRDAQQGAVNERIGSGNTINNVPAFFGPQAAFVEYHVPGTEEYSGMDWRSLRLVFLPEDGTWHLAGLVHDEWTI